MPLDLVMKPTRCWALYDPLTKAIWSHSIRVSKQAAIDVGKEEYQLPWRTLRSWGWRAVRVDVKPVRRASDAG